ncbi:polyphosphate:AMP phosphotransferase [Anaeromassilibacillus senegalensis]|uniref:Polyphosphate:AMP phosphotransferase n=1 Tax=Anaeromassilibacillus senegalensis TaxID=1673717 RepID=A0ABS9CQ42_9FIRM|nr:polyphosphate:AMP phosphotransferase [Anaeromassilibacillus senegalensis]MCF2652486.1 polyphosphate:AMP phosphotransferase [Anaeromassilibacillus senegalensis]MCI5652183.1 polyphosphate:AMP phosphotransferase [Ruminococcus bromii]
MLEKIDLSKKMSKKEFNTLMRELDAKLGRLQRICKEKRIPVIIAVEGFGAAGKGTMINRLIEPLDPRGFKVYTTQSETENEHYHPFLWRFWNMMPGKGRISILDRSWYRILLNDRFDGKTDAKSLATAADEINSFEKLLTDDHIVLIKFFLVISQKEQKKRLKKLAESKETAWRVTDGDWKRCEHYDEYFRLTEEALQKTDRDNAPWTIIESEDREYAAAKVISTVVKRLEDAIADADRRAKLPRASVEESAQIFPDAFRASALAGIDLSKTLTKEQYQKQLKELQKKLSRLHGELYQRRIPVVLAFEGWDAGGKGGAIKRLTQALDPRGYEVHPVSAPNDLEKSHHYLWRFWTAVPKAGHIAIFDRSWYGRVMVERLEGFCSEDEWRRAYKEINNMEECWANSGCIVLKFWMQIDKDEQERRFTERQQNPDKQWKITDEDWRNRAKWDQYEVAVDEMLVRTSTTYAPWIIVEANSKYYARIKVLKTVVDAIEQYLKTHK